MSLVGYLNSRINYVVSYGEDAVVAAMAEAINIPRAVFESVNFNIRATVQNYRVGYYLAQLWPWNKEQVILTAPAPFTTSSTSNKPGFGVHPPCPGGVTNIQSRMNNFAESIVGTDGSPGPYGEYDKQKGPKIAAAYPCDNSHVKQNYLSSVNTGVNLKPWYVLNNNHNLVENGYNVNFQETDLYKVIPTTSNRGKGVDWPDPAGINVPEGWRDPGGERFSVRKFIESSDIDKQCEYGFRPVKRGDICYICRFPLISWGTKADTEGGLNGPMTTGYVCEHKIPVFLMALICGIYGSKSEDAKQYLFGKLPHLLSGYNHWQSIIWVQGYGWSHSVCNFIKNDLPFILFKLNVLQGFDLNLNMEYSESNARHLLKRLLKYNRINEQIWRKWYTSFLGNQLDIDFVDTASFPQPQKLSTANDLGNEDKDKLDWWVERTSNEMFNADIIPLMNALNGDKVNRIKYQACSLIIVGITIVDNSKGKYHLIDNFPDEFRTAFESACTQLHLPTTPAGLNAILSQSGGMRSKITSKMGNMRRAKNAKGKTLKKRPTSESLLDYILIMSNKNLQKSRLGRKQIFLNTISYYIKNTILNDCKTGRWNEAYKDINICLYHLFDIMEVDELLLDDLKPYTTEELEGELNMESRGGNTSVGGGSYNNSQKGGEKKEQELIEDMNKYITENIKTHPQDFLNNIKIYTTIQYRFYKIVNITRIITRIQRIFRERRRISSIDEGSKKHIKKKSKKKKNKTKKKKSKKRKSDKKKSKKKKIKNKK